MHDLIHILRLRTWQDLLKEIGDANPRFLLSRIGVRAENEDFFRIQNASQDIP